MTTRLPDTGPAPVRPERPAHATDPAPPVPPPATTLEIVSWRDPVLDSTGFDPRHIYVEKFWLGLLGPSACWLLRRLARGIDTYPNGYRIDLADTARALGLGESTAKNAAIRRTITRIQQFRLARAVTDERLEVRSHLPPLSDRQVERLPPSLRAAHDDWCTNRHDHAVSRRAAAAAAGLARAGESPEVIDAQLRAWGFPPG